MLFPQRLTGKRQVSTEGGTRASWSADGKELFFRSTDSKTGYSLMSVAVSPGEEFTASQPRALFRFSCNQAGHDYAPTPDGQHFLCIKPPESENCAPVATPCSLYIVVTLPPGEGTNPKSVPSQCAA